MNYYLDGGWLQKVSKDRMVRKVVALLNDC